MIFLFCILQVQVQKHKVLFYRHHQRYVTSLDEELKKKMQFIFNVQGDLIDWGWYLVVLDVKQKKEQMSPFWWNFLISKILDLFNWLHFLASKKYICWIKIRIKMQFVSCMKWFFFLLMLLVSYVQVINLEFV